MKDLLNHIYTIAILISVAVFWGLVIMTDGKLMIGIMLIGGLILVYWGILTVVRDFRDFRRRRQE